MESDSSRPGTPAEGPLQAVTPDRVNQRRESVASGRDSSVFDKISQFNSLSVSMQSKQLERKTADAALKRAMMGREAAESDVRRVKEEVQALRKAVEDGQERERRVGERLETVMESYGRAKETHAHTQALWEKEIRRSRKETFKSQSSLVKLQEELKYARGALKTAEESLDREKERSHTREQEAFAARYNIVGVQEQLAQALERIKLVEQERDAFKTAAKNEEVARIAAEGRLPLPPAQDDDEFASPKKTKKSLTGKTFEDVKGPRISLSTMEIVSSAASELEIEELSLQVQWHRQRADRAQEMTEFLQAECRMHCCPCSKLESRASRSMTYHDAVEVVDPVVEALPSVESESDDIVDSAPQAEPTTNPRPKKKARRSTIFCPKEGIFRTVSEQEAAALDVHDEAEEVGRESEEEAEAESSTPTADVAETNPRQYARTPSVDPPAFAMLVQERTSLLSLLNAPHDEAHSAPLPTILSVPTVPDEDSYQHPAGEMDEDEPEDEPEEASLPQPRPHTSAATYTMTTTTTVPVRDESDQLGSSLNERLRTPSSGSNTSFDLKDPAMTPTMSREEALAKIRERRGRARSAAQGTTAAAAAKRKMGPDGGASRRDLSAPANKGRKSRS